ncbi:adhesion G-protein coupled receptor G6-like [Strongylocentrotus purpuratus]|uniref:Uncharacterized protein n=1 Tax=Strongylocentrotus purpuratus TaxID=7668 RepID=A0A7M7HMU7_STRPU|nr:adhesion G-protein coupled receptor G6-like [Strongylocentrotus purpuratus]
MIGNDAIDDIIEPIFGIDVPGFEVTSYLISRYTGYNGVKDICNALETAFTEVGCGKNLTAEEILEILRNVEITLDNVANVAEELEDVTRMDQNIFLEGINVVAELFEDINEINSTETKVTKSMVGIVNNIAALPDELLGMAEEENSSPSRVVSALEAQLAVVEVENGSSRFVETNVAAEVLDVTTEDISQGYTVFMAVTDDGESISDEDFKVDRGDLTQEPEAAQAQATLFIPSGLADKFSGRRGRLVITTYRVPSLFQDTGIAQFNQDVEEFNRTLNSRIISASINNEKVEDLSEPVRISFTPLNPKGTDAQCVFWDFDDKAWSQRGCNKTSNDTSDRIECECNHLTNFGILMDIYGGEHLSVEADFILKIVSYVGCLISISGLVMTIFTYATNKKLRDRKPNQILLSLCCALLGLYVVFIVMISVDTKRDVTELSPLPCSILAAFLQYFILAAIFWMAVEGFNMHNLLALVRNYYLPRFMKKASLIAWGCPLLIVGITAAASRQYYAQTDFCFLAFWSLIGGLLIPIGVVMIFNFVIYVRVLMRLNTKTMKGRHLDKTEKRLRIRQFQNAVCILTLMGLTWSVGYLSIIQPASAVVQGIFTVLNSLQGYFIFMLYCVRQPQVRLTWRSQFKCCLPKYLTTPSAVSSGSGQPSSTLKNSSADLKDGPFPTRTPAEIQRQEASSTEETF